MIAPNPQPAKASQGLPPETPEAPDSGQGGPMMPGDEAPPAPVTPGAPPSVSRQAMQLIVVPALICLAALGTMFSIYTLVHRADTLETTLVRLEAPSGSGPIALGLRDPRYQERCRAATRLAQLLPGMSDPALRESTGRRLVKVLSDSLQPHEHELRAYLLLAVGQLGPERGLDALAQGLEDREGMVRLTAARALSSWPDPDAARALLPRLLALTRDAHAPAASEAVRVAGVLASPGDREALAALRTALNDAGPDRREVSWNAAVALARQGDEEGSLVVAGLLLDRAALAQTLGSSRTPGDVMSRDEQDRVILAALASASLMTHPRVWDKIRALQSGDPSALVRRAASAVIAARDRAAPAPLPVPPAPVPSQVSPPGGREPEAASTRDSAN